MEISDSKVFHRFLFKKFIPKLAGEENLLSKTFIYMKIYIHIYRNILLFYFYYIYIHYDNGLVAFYVTHIELIALVVCSLKLPVLRLQFKCSLINI